MKPAPWHDVLAGLTGDRLALYDDMLRIGAVDPAVMGRHAASGQWLVQHRLAWHDTLDGYLRPREMIRAREQWERMGPLETTAADPIPEPLLYQAPLHDHQPQLFAV